MQGKEEEGGRESGESKARKRVGEEDSERHRRDGKGGDGRVTPKTPPTWLRYCKWLHYCEHLPVARKQYDEILHSSSPPLSIASCLQSSDVAHMSLGVAGFEVHSTNAISH